MNDDIEFQGTVISGCHGVGEVSTEGGKGNSGPYTETGSDPVVS